MSKVKRGDTVYKQKGYTKPILVHVDEKTHARLKAIAGREDRSLQVTVRRILEHAAHQSSGK